MEPGPIAALLEGTDIAELELTGPGCHLLLRREAGRVATVAAVATLSLGAPTPGRFLHRHPLHDLPLAVPGMAVAAGQVLGLLRIGALLLPVAAPRPGRFAGYRAADGATVGYGTPLLDLEPME